MYYEKILTDKLRLEQEIADAKKELHRLPKAKLICAKNGKGYKWYESDGHTVTYLPKKKRARAEALARRKFLEEHVVHLQREKRALERYLINTEKIPSDFTYKTLTHPGFFSLLSPYLKYESEKLTLWAEEKYERNPYHPEKCIFKTPRGFYVRSKSEVVIAMILDQYKIPYRYEAGLLLGETTIYPDFTLRHPVTGDFYYWEHFGMMDDETYTVKASKKIAQYSLNGIVPSVNLLMTFETGDEPLRLEYVRKLIEIYFT